MPPACTAVSHRGTQAHLRTLAHFRTLARLRTLGEPGMLAMFLFVRFTLCLPQCASGDAIRGYYAPHSLHSNRHTHPRLPI